MLRLVQSLFSAHSRFATITRWSEGPTCEQEDDLEVDIELDDEDILGFA